MNPSSLNAAHSMLFRLQQRTKDVAKELCKTHGLFQEWEQVAGWQPVPPLPKALIPDSAICLARGLRKETIGPRRGPEVAAEGFCNSAAQESTELGALAVGHQLNTSTLPAATLKPGSAQGRRRGLDCCSCMGCLSTRSSVLGTRARRDCPCALVPCVLVPSIHAAAAVCRAQPTLLESSSRPGCCVMSRLYPRLARHAASALAEPRASSAWPPRLRAGIPGTGVIPGMAVRKPLPPSAACGMTLAGSPLAAGLPLDKAI